MNMILVPKSVFRDLLMRGVKNPLPIEAFFDREESMTKQPETPEAPPLAEPSPFDGLVAGRIVYYWPRLHEARNCAPGPWAAIVTAVKQLVEGAEFEPGIVTLSVFLPAPMTVGVDPVRRFVDVKYSDADSEGCWSWMFAGLNTRYKPDRTS